jgi:hypothetical protein
VFRLVARTRISHTFMQRARLGYGWTHAEIGMREADTRHRRRFVIQCMHEAGVPAVCERSRRAEKVPSYLIRVMPA